jgi:hypothetical protein
MRPKLLAIAAACLAALVLPVSVRADGRGGSSHGGSSHGGSSHGRPSHGGSFHGGGSHHRGGSVWVSPFWGGWGWGWGWGWGPGYYGPYSPYPYGRFAVEPSGWTAVKTDVEPDEAAVYLDGRLIGTADDFDGFPDRLYLGPGTYTIEFRLEGFRTLTSTVDAAPGRSFDIDRHLEKVPGARRHGTYSPAEPEGGIVRFFVKGADQAAIPWSPGSPGAAAGAPAPPRERVEADEEATAPAPRGAPIPEARIVFRVRPDDAAVYIDDRYAGLARELGAVSEGIAVGPGRHTITVSRPGYQEQSKSVDAEDGGTVRVEISLDRR